MLPASDLTAILANLGALQLEPTTAAQILAAVLAPLLRSAAPPELLPRSRAGRPRARPRKVPRRRKRARPRLRAAAAAAPEPTDGPRQRAARALAANPGVSLPVSPRSPALAAAPPPTPAVMWPPRPASNVKPRLRSPARSRQPSPASARNASSWMHSPTAPSA
jgi:hypothetical protein